MRSISTSALVAYLKSQGLSDPHGLMPAELFNWSSLHDEGFIIMIAEDFLLLWYTVLPGAALPDTASLPIRPAMALVGCHRILFPGRYPVLALILPYIFLLYEKLEILFVWNFLRTCSHQRRSDFLVSHSGNVRFEAFHMYGIFMTAVPVGALSLFLIRN